MADFIFWLEGVDFDNTLLDTADISTMRGASLTLLRAPEFAKSFLESKLGDKNIETIFTGASMGAFELNGDKTDIETAVEALQKRLATDGEAPEDIRKAEARNKSSRFGNIDTVPFAHMRFVTGLSSVSGDNKDQALEQAKSMAEASRYINGSPRRRINRDKSAVVSPAPCAKSRMRAAETTIMVGSDDDGFGTKELAVSRSVAARRYFGRWARQGFYRANLAGGGEWFDWDKYTFVDSLHEMVENTVPEHGETVDGKNKFNPPVSVSNKIAVFYADGNKFGKIRQACQDRKGDLEGLQLFSTELLKKQREHLLTPIVRNLHDQVNAGSKSEIDRVVYFDSRDNFYKLRLETLLWGGDEVKFVMPAWLGWWFAREFFKAVEDWKIDGQALTFSAGMVFCNYKTPIRSARALARGLAEDGKKTLGNELSGQRNILNVEVLESVDPPQEGIAHMRRRLSGFETQDHIIAGEKVGEFIDQIARLKGIDSVPPEEEKQNLPRSQVYRILQAIKQGGMTIAEGVETAESELAQYIERGGTDRGVAFTRNSLKLPGTSGNLVMSLYQIAQHWDYVDEFACSSELIKDGSGQ